MSAAFASVAVVLACPRCRKGGVARERAGWMCAVCSSGFPEIGGIPWLFAEPQAALAEWRGRTNLLLGELEGEAQALREELAAPGLHALTRTRLERLAGAYADQAVRLRKLLAPIDPANTQMARETLLALRTRLPLDQGLTNYYVNLHRDWCWGEEENAASLSLIMETLGGRTAGRVLVLGAGGGRLARDLHEAAGAELTVAADFNPLLLFVAREVLSGGSVELYEFPIAPRALEDEARLRVLRAPASRRDARPDAPLFLVACDALRPPFAAGAFDTVVTPWFIDIVPETLPRLAARVNALLASGGDWLNFGSLSFAQGPRSARFSLEEALAIVGDAGFEIPQPREAQLPYMRSPASRHSRLETVIAWCTSKQREMAPPPEHSTLPEWLLDPTKPVPATRQFQLQAMTTRVYAFLMALIDGRRSVRDMAQMLVEQRLMAPHEAEPAVRGFLARMHEDVQKRTSF